MNPALLSQLIQLIQWGITGALAFKANDAFVGQFADTLKAALAENRPLTDEEWAPIDAAAAAASQRLQDA